MFQSPGPIVLLLDSGGGREGMHLSLEFALLMSRSEIHVYALREYFTKALMPLDREPHKQMQLAWSNLKSRFAAEHGHSVQNQFQALALLREAWAAGTQEKHVLSGWRRTGIAPWCPDELLLEQAHALFRSQREEAKNHRFMDPASKNVLKLPDTMMEKKTTCTKCKGTILQRFRHCSECGAVNEAFLQAASSVMQEGRRKGYKKMRPTAFNIEALVEKGFEGLRAVSQAGKEALEESSSSDSSSDSDAEEEPDACEKLPLPAPTLAAAETPKLPLPAPTPAAAGTPKPPPPAPKSAAPATKLAVYDPPTYIPSQLKSRSTLKKAWSDILVDIDDAKHKKAFLHWVPEFMDMAKEEMAKHFKKDTATEVMYKSVLDRVAKKTHEERQKWYNERVSIMLTSVDKEAAKTTKAK